MASGRIGRIILRCQSRPQGAFGIRATPATGAPLVSSARCRPRQRPPPRCHLRPRRRGLPRAGADPRRRRAGLRPAGRRDGDAIRHEQLDGHAQRLRHAPGRAWHRRPSRRDRHQHLGHDHPPADARAGHAAPVGPWRRRDADRAARRGVRRDPCGRRGRSRLERRATGPGLRRADRRTRPGGDLSHHRDRGGCDPRRGTVRGHQRRPALPDARRPHAGCRGDRRGAAGHLGAAATGHRQAGAGHVPGHPGG